MSGGARTTRRGFLWQSLGVVGLGVPALQGCEKTGFRWPWQEPRDVPVVDAHCHIFNATDLSIEGFAQQVVLKGRGGRFDWLVKALRWALEKGTPGFEEEDALLDELLDPSFRAAAEAELMQGIDPTPEEFRAFLEELEGQDPAGYEGQLQQELGPSADLGSLSDEELEAQLFGGRLGRVFAWGFLLRRYRWEIGRKLELTYPEVDLFTPALVDMALWLDDPPETAIPEQILLGEKIARASGGRIHPLVAFDPLRQARHAGGESPLAWVQEAVLQRGFLGVKLYPPMGFRPMGNQDPSLDEAMKALLGWCEENAVPVMAHCANSNEASPGAGQNASPASWAPALEMYPELILHLGHFGGDDALEADPPADWGPQIGELSARYQNVFADTGYHEAVLQGDAQRQAYERALARAVAGHPPVVDRLVYGSDWQMIFLEEASEQYFDRSKESAANALGAGAIDRFMGGNALRMHGLHGPDTPARSRLLDFYLRHGLTQPPGWWQGDWPLG